MTLYHGVDAAYPGVLLPARTSILAAYVGSHNAYGPDTPHIWTSDDWNEYIDKFPSLRLLPIYTHNYDNGTPEKDADNAVDAVRSLGWEPFATHRRIIAFDIETLVDPKFVYAVGQRIYDRGFRCMPYGSSSTVTQNPDFMGYWQAILSNRAPSVLPPNTRGIQWAWNVHGWDLDVFDDSVYLGCGMGLRN